MELPIKPTQENQDSLQPVLFEMGDIESGAQDKRGWTTTVNGKEVETINRASFENRKMGITVEYGQRPEGYDGVVIREPGGAATIPYMIHPETGGIYVGIVSESRPTMGQELTDNIPRGFSDFDAKGNKEDSLRTAERELLEETGFDATKRSLSRRAMLLAEGLNPNSTYFDFSDGPKDGVSIYTVAVGLSELDVKHTDDGEVYYAFPEEIQQNAELDKAGERILGSRFIPLAEALKSRDMFTSAATGQLIAHLLNQGEYILPQNSKPVDKSELVTPA